MNCYTKALLLLFLFCFPEISFAQDFKDFLGTNTRREDPTDRLDAVGFVREYHLWALDEQVPADCNNLDEIVVFNSNTTNPSPQYIWEGLPGTTETSFVTYYQKLLEDNREMCITLKGSLPFFDNGDCTFDFGKPPVFNEDPSHHTVTLEDCSVTSMNITSTQAEAYTWYTNYISSLSSFFTNGGYTKHYVGDNTENVFQGKTFYLENWNEQDKWWCSDPFQNSFTPEEYAIMSSVNYDGVMAQYDFVPGFIGSVGNPNNSQFVMGGLLDIENLEILNEDGTTNHTLNVYEYLADVKTKMEDYRTDGEFIFDVLNFHNYRFSDFGLPRSYGLAPEENDGDETGHPNLYSKLEALNAHIASLGLADRDVWLSEFGYDTNPFSDGVALPSYELTLDEPIDVGEDVGTPGSCETTIINSNEVSSFNLRDLGTYQNITPSPNGPDISNGQHVMPYVRRFWNDLSRKNQREVLNVIYETQARWLVRGYMEVRKAEWDKVIQFCIRDEEEFRGPIRNTADPCIINYRTRDYRFKQSGLLDAPSKGFQPKPSYYYTKTMKEVLSGTTELEAYDELLSNGQESKTTKIYKFSDAAGTKTIYALWLPTPEFGESHTVPVANLPGYVQGISASSTLIELEAPYDKGKWSSLGNSITITDKPVFISTAAYQNPGLPTTVCEERIEVEYQTCRHVRLSVDDTEDWDRYIVYYAPGGSVVDLDNPQISELVLFDDNIRGDISEITITDFQKEESKFCDYYSIYIRGVKDLGDHVYMTDLCRKSVKTKNCVCTVDLTLDVLSVNACDDADAAASLFDYSGLDLCDLESQNNKVLLGSGFTAGTEPSWEQFNCDGSPDNPGQPFQSIEVDFDTPQK